MSNEHNFLPGNSNNAEGEQPEPVIIRKVRIKGEDSIDEMAGEYGTSKDLDRFERFARILRVLNVPEEDIESMRTSMVDVNLPNGTTIRTSNLLLDILYGENSTEDQ